MTQTRIRGEAATDTAVATTAFRRIAGAIALPAAIACHLVCNSIYAWASTESGLTDTEDVAQAYRLYASHPTAMVACTLLVIVGGLLLIPGLLAAVRVLRPARPRLGLWAVVLMIVGYVSYLGIAFTNVDALTLATGAPEVAAVMEQSPWQAVTTPFFLLFVIGNLGGTLLLGLAGRRVGVPWWAGLLLLGWPVGHIANIAGGGEWFAVAGGALELVGCVILAAAALRLSDADWVRRG